MKIKPCMFTPICDEEYEITDEHAIEAMARGLKAVRKWRGYTLKQVEQQTEIPNPTISRYENGENVPSVIQTMKLCTLYEIDIEDIFMCGLMIDEQRDEYLENIKKNEQAIERLIKSTNT